MAQAATTMLLSSATPTNPPPLNHRRCRHSVNCIAGSTRTKFIRPNKVRAMAKEDRGGSGGATAQEAAAVGGGLVAVPVIGWSLYTLKTTGCGLPPGPGGSIGALEGVSYLVVGGIVAWSLYTKNKTGSGLPNGPFGLLGAVEGLSYLALLAIIVVFGLQYFETGSIPGPLPSDQCFG